jgi:hypothetical protein
LGELLFSRNNAKGSETLLQLASGDALSDVENRTEGLARDFRVMHAACPSLTPPSMEKYAVMRNPVAVEAIIDWRTGDPFTIQ